MRENKFRYTFIHVLTGNVEQKIYTLSQLEERNLKELSPCFNAEFGYKLISRDDFTGLKDKNDKEIYEGDIVRFIKNRVRVGTRRAKVGRSYESYGIYEDKEIVGTVEHGVFVNGIRDKFIPCLMVNTEATTTYDHYFWGEGKRNDKPDVAIDNLSEPLFSDKEYEIIGNIFENSKLLES